jgi:hypothetical protein
MPQADHSGDGEAAESADVDERPPLTHCPICDAPLNMKETDRSWQQLKRYHAEVRAWFNYWPDKDRWHFHDLTNFRKRLQMAAGHRKLSSRIPVMNPETGEVLDAEFLTIMLRAAFGAAGAHAQAEPNGDYIDIYVPKSVALHRMSSVKFSLMYDRCREIFEQETGLKADQVFKED